MVVARGYPTERYKMNGIFEFDQAKALVNCGHKIVYAAVDVRSIRRWREWGIEIKNIDGVEIYAFNIPCGRVPKVVLRKAKMFGLSVLYKRIVREHGKPDVMHAHFLGVGYAAALLNKGKDLPFVVTEHDVSLMTPTINRSTFCIAEKVYESANALIAVSTKLKEIIENNFSVNAIFIPNMVDTKLFAYEPNRSDSMFRFVSAGGLIPLKRMDLTIEAFARAFKNDKNVTLTIFGEGPERKKLTNMIYNHGLEDRVKLMGLQSREILAAYLKKSDGFILSSQFETFGLAYVEALVSGVPVIATKCGGPESFVNKKNGILVPVDDVKKTAEAMKMFYTSINEYDKKAISDKAKKLFSPDSIVTKLENVYEFVIKDFS